MQLYSMWKNSTARFSNNPRQLAFTGLGSKAPQPPPVTAPAPAVTDHPQLPPAKRPKVSYTLEEEQNMALYAYGRLPQKSTKISDWQAFAAEVSPRQNHLTFSTLIGLFNIGPLDTGHNEGESTSSCLTMRMQH